jgi:steroid 5-alpha reductase family enzyme
MLLELLGLGLGAILMFMTVIWIISLIVKDSSIVDMFWGAGFVVMVLLYFFTADDGWDTRKLILVIVVTLWGLRLSGYIGWRNWGEPEDYRYQKWRQQHGDSWWWASFFRVFVLQGVILWIVAFPLLAAQSYGGHDSLTIFDIVGVIFWAIGLYFEGVGDYQLAHFKANPDNKGKVMNTGLWRYTRHPNYFGDAMVWWGFYLIAVGGGGWWTIFSPIIMTFFLMFVSGAALLERNLTETKPKYRDYIETTNAFFPWFPKKKTSSDTETASL